MADHEGVPVVTVAGEAMATRFEIVLPGDRAAAARAAGEEALEVIQRLDRQLSLYRPDSEIASLNQRASEEPVRVSPSLFHLLARARSLWSETQGLFDITVAPLMRCWGFMGEDGRVPSPDELARAQACVGMDKVRLDPERFTVRFTVPGMMLDLGAIGKGYAVDKAVETLEDAGVAHALVHGGTSTIRAMGMSPSGEAWKVTLEMPAGQMAQEQSGSPALPAPAPLAVVELRDESLSVSAVWGKSFTRGETTYGHVMDPRSGIPAAEALMAVVVLPSAADSDALSTALLAAGASGGGLVLTARPHARTFCVRQEDGLMRFDGHGIAARIPR